MSRTTRRLVAVLLPVSFVALSSRARPDETTVFDKTKKEWLTILDKDDKPRMRKAAVIALGIFGPGQKEILPALTNALAKDKDESVRIQVVTILGQLGEKDLQDGLPTFADVLKGDKSPEVRAGAARLIGKLGEKGKPALKVLIDSLKDADAGVRAASVEAIARIGPEAAKPAMTEMLPLLKDPDVSVRFATVFAYGRLGQEAAFVVPDLNQVLEHDTDADVRREVAKAFGLFGVGAKPGIMSLAKALREDKAPEVRRQAALALGKIGPDIAVIVSAMKDGLRQDADRIVRLYIVRSLSAALGADLKEHVKDLGDVLRKDPDGDVRLAIVQELGALGTGAKEALKDLEDAQSDVVLQIREEAKRAIDRLTAKPKKVETKKDEKK